MAVKISKQRFHSDVYWTTKNQKIGRPIVINIRKAYSDRKAAERDLQMVTETLPGLGFKEPFVLDSKDGGLDTKTDLLRRVVDLANNEEMTIKSDVFLCVIMAYGEANCIYTAGPNPERVEISDVISIFKADRCHGLVCKPKIFIIHTDYHRLRKVRRERQHHAEGDVQTLRVPVEGDILLYHSQMSAEYVDYIRARDPKLYCDLMEKGLVETLESLRRKMERKLKVRKSASGIKENTNNDGEINEEDNLENDINENEEDDSSTDGQKKDIDDDGDDKEDNVDTDEYKSDENNTDDVDDNDDDNADDQQKKKKGIGTHFIYTLCKTAKDLTDDGRFDINDWIFRTNARIKEVMERSRDMDDGEWKPKPRLPLCTSQLTKPLVINDLATRVT